MKEEDDPLIDEVEEGNDDALHDVEIETIKRHLKDDELKGSIKIRKSLHTQQ